MKIVRGVNGTEVEFELTDQELREAYYEQQHKFDIEDIEWAFEDVSEEEIIETYGLPLEEIKPLLDRIAYRYRKYRNDDEGWTYDRDEAISYILSAYMEEKEREEA